MIKLRTVKNWGVTVDPQQNGKILVGGVGTVNWGSNPLTPGVIPTLVTLLAFAAERRADRYLLPAGPTAANPPQRHAAVDKWARQTDKQTDGHCTIT